MSYTPDQQKLIDAADGFNLACALPGSGKTHTLVGVTEKILDVNPSHRVLVVTFTNAAVNEMRARLQRSLAAALVRKTRVSTFHSLFLEQAKAHMVGSLVVGPAQSALIIRALRSVGSPMEFMEASEVIERHARNPRMAMRRDESAVVMAYEGLKKTYQQYDLNDATRKALALTAAGQIPPVAETHILVDEFQDVDDMQLGWVVLQGQAGRKVTVVGDDDQSIYGWRGSAGYAAMKTFQEAFNAEGHLLSVCFRCRPEILALAKTLVEHNTNRIPKVMRANKAKGGAVRIHQCADRQAQTMRVAEVVREFPGQWAVLARGNANLQRLQMELEAEGIPTMMMGGKPLWDDVRVNGYLKVLHTVRNPDKPRYLHDALGYLTEREEVINDIVKRSNRGLIGLMESRDARWDSPTARLIAGLPGWQPNTVNEQEIRNRLAQILAIARDGVTPETYDKDEPYKMAKEEVVNGIIERAEGSWHERLDRLLDILTRPKTKEVKKEEPGKVTLCTFHSSKGLEWRNVAIVDLTDTQVPLIKESETRSTTDLLEEERRLFFVAMTRAEERLELMYPSMDGNGNDLYPSFFLEEIKAPAAPKAKVANC